MLAAYLLRRWRYTKPNSVTETQEASLMKEWESFEIAVAEFVAALDPTAIVRHNVRLPDKHTA